MCPSQAQQLLARQKWPRGLLLPSIDALTSSQAGTPNAAFLPGSEDDNGSISSPNQPSRFVKGSLSGGVFETTSVSRTASVSSPSTVGLLKRIRSTASRPQAMAMASVLPGGGWPQPCQEGCRLPYNQLISARIAPDVVTDVVTDVISSPVDVQA